jgi:hypothetical protein
MIKEHSVLITLNNHPTNTTCIKKQFSISEATLKQLEIIKRYKGGNKSQLVRKAIDLYFEGLKHQGKLRLIE